MKDLTFGTLIAVMEEVFGRGLFWSLVAVAAVVTIAYAYVLIRDRGVGWKRFLWAQVSMPFGAVASVAFVLWITESSLADMGGPIDVIVLLFVAVLGAVGLAILVYTVESLLIRGRDRPVG